MSKSPVFTKGQRVRCQKSNVEFVVEAQANAVVIGRTMQIVYGSCGERAFADDCRLAVNDEAVFWEIGREKREVVGKLIESAMSILHHDGDRGSAEVKWEIESLRKAFSKIIGEL